MSITVTVTFRMDKSESTTAYTFTKKEYREATERALDWLDRDNVKSVNIEVTK